MNSELDHPPSDAASKEFRLEAKAILIAAFYFCAGMFAGAMLVLFLISG